MLTAVRVCAAARHNGTAAHIIIAPDELRVRAVTALLMKRLVCGGRDGGLSARSAEFRQLWQEGVPPLCIQVRPPWLDTLDDTICSHENTR